MDPIQTKTPLTLTGSIDSVDILDSGAQPNTVISVTDDFTVRVSWTLAGSAVPYVGGTWSVRALVESIGKGYEGQVGDVVKVDLDGRTTPYTADILVPAGTLPTPNDGEDTVYKLVALVSHAEFNKKTLIAGFGEGAYFEVQV